MATKARVGDGKRGESGFATPLRLVRRAKARKGLTREVVEEISWRKGEPEWMRQKRLQSYSVFERMPFPTWGPDLSGLNLDEIVFYTPLEAARARYTTVQNWSKNVYNLNTKRALVLGEDATMEWVGGSLGSGVTMLYPASILLGRGARADHLNISVAGRGQRKDTGAKVVHAAPRTTSRVVAKSISMEGGWSSYRGLVRVTPAAVGAEVNVRCDALMLDDRSRSDTWPDMQIGQSDVTVEHEATVGRISEEQMLYLMSRGIKEGDARAMIVNGFIEPVARELPMEYAVELNRLIQLEISGDLG